MLQKIDYSVYKDCDLSCLSGREEQVMSLKIENPSLSYEEIGKQIGISVTNASTLLYNARAKLDGKHTVRKNTTRNPKARNHKPWNHKSNNLFDLVHSLGPDFDTSRLSKRELKLFNIVLNATHAMSNEEMAKEMGIKPANIGAAVYYLRLKIDVSYAESYENAKKKRREYNKASEEKIREYNRKYHMEHRDEMLEKQKEINRAYYIANRERILEKNRQKSLERKNSTAP